MEKKMRFVGYADTNRPVGDGLSGEQMPHMLESVFSRHPTGLWGGCRTEPCTLANLQLFDLQKWQVFMVQPNMFSKAGLKTRVESTSISPPLFSPCFSSFLLSHMNVFSASFVPGSDKDWLFSLCLLNVPNLTVTSVSGFMPWDPAAADTEEMAHEGQAATLFIWDMPPGVADSCLLCHWVTGTWGGLML